LRLSNVRGRAPLWSVTRARSVTARKKGSRRRISVSFTRSDALE
jgi:hypothetical protein